MAQKQRNNLAIYDDVAADWWSDDIRWVRTLKNLVPGRLKWFDTKTDWAGQDVLDIGCAGGFMAEELVKKGAKVTGIDPAEQAIEAARARADHMGQDIRYDVGVGENLPYPDASFDIIVCVDVLEHVQDLGKVLAEAARVLRPDGLFLYDTINHNPIARLVTIKMAEDVLRILPKGTHDPDMFIKPGTLRSALKAAGLTPKSQTGLGPRWINKRGDFVFGPLPFQTVMYMGAAQKA